MSTNSGSKLHAWASDRRVQVGGVIGLSLAAALGAGLIAVIMNSRADATQPDLAQQARLTIVSQPGQKPAVEAGDKLATLDPSQASAAPADPVDPGFQAVIDQERREDQRAAAEQRAFDARLRAEMAPTSEEDVPPAPEPRPAARAGWTSNAEDAADGPG